MSIDTTHEKLINLQDVRRRIAAVRGEMPSSQAVWRWVAEGLGPRKRRLESVRQGKRIITSEEALDRWMHALAKDYDEARVSANAVREAEIAAAEDELREV